MAEFRYEPSDWGRKYHALKCDEALGGGAVGPGKSFVLLMDILGQLLTEHERATNRDHPHPIEMGRSVGRALHLRRTRPMLTETLDRARAIFPLIDAGAHWVERDMTWEFSSGYKLKFGHCAELNDWEQYRSNEYSHIALDELIQFTERQYDEIRMRCRTGDPVLGPMCKVRSMSNPSLRKQGETFTVDDPYWVRRRFVDPCREGYRLLKTRIVRRDGTVDWHTRMFMPATLYDNPNPEFVKRYETQLMTQRPHMRQALIYGDWYVSEGSFFADAWNPRLHICKPFHIPRDWPRWRSMDWGYKQPGCLHWYAMDPEGNVFVYKEIRFQTKTDIEVCRIVREFERKEGFWKDGRSLLTGPADTQLWEERGESAKSKVQVFLENGIHWVQASKGRERNAELITQRLLDHGGGTTTPGLVLFDHCDWIIKTLPGIQADEKYPEQPQEGGDDHAYDSLQYGVAFASRGRAGIPRVPRDKDRFHDRFERPQATNERGRHGYGSVV